MSPHRPIVFFALLLSLSSSLPAADIDLTLTYQVETSKGSGRYHRLQRAERWKARETAIIICDVWDLHHCLNAVRRVEQFAPRLNRLLVKARQQGVTIIHSPSDCMPAYQDHPARKRAIAAPRAAKLPRDIKSWCSRIPGEERAVYPIDQSDGGEDDDPAEHAQWVAKLKSLGRNPGTPWKRQSKLITIDADRDYVSDRGDEVWNVLEARGIKNVILTGVHVNMCVLGRPFGLRQMARNGKKVALVRDMTDAMYNPRRWPYVSHFTGNDLIISHIEKFVCPTITSDQFLGGKPLRFKQDKRPHLVIVAAEDEYKTERTLPRFASTHLGRSFRVSYVFGSDRDLTSIPGLNALDTADIALLSVRRRVLPAQDMEIVKRFVKSGRPVVGIRTASHAFSLRGKPAPSGYVAWPEFDAHVFGGNYTGHHGNKLKSTVSVVPSSSDISIVRGLKRAFPQGGSLYKTSPLAQGTRVLLTGKVDGRRAEPVAWTFTRADGGRSFYTSMGHIADFENESFLRMLVGGIHWAAGLRADDAPNAGRSAVHAYRKHWAPIAVPASWESAAGGTLQKYDGVGWYRCVVRVPKDWMDEDGLQLLIEPGDDKMQAWWNGHPLQAAPSSRDGKHRQTMRIPAQQINSGDANLLVVRVLDGGGAGGLRAAPVLVSGKKRLILKGRWQLRVGKDPSLSNMPLPAKFGTTTDMFFEPG